MRQFFLTSKYPSILRTKSESNLADKASSFSGFRYGDLRYREGLTVAFAASNLSVTFPAVEDKEVCFGDESFAEVIWSRSHVSSKAIWRGQDGRVHSVRLLWLRTFH